MLGAVESKVGALDSTGMGFLMVFDGLKLWLICCQPMSFSACAGLPLGKEARCPYVHRNGQCR